MAHSIHCAIGLAITVAVSTIGGEPKAGLELGDFRMPFDVRDVTGPHAGSTFCYACETGLKPTICLFIRELGTPVADLIERLDAKAASNADLGIFVVVLPGNADPEATAASLKELAESRGLQNVPLTIAEDLEGLEPYELNPDAAVTALMWKTHRLKVNRGFESADLDESDVEAILAAIPTLLND